jgi:DNA-binding protein HU-beta
MYKHDLVKRVARDQRLSQRVANDAITSALKVIRESLAEGKAVTFPGFGKFYTRMQPEGTVTHIKTKEPLKIPARQVVGFRVGNILKKSVRNAKRQKTGSGVRGLLKKAMAKQH